MIGVSSDGSSGSIDVVVLWQQRSNENLTMGDSGRRFPVNVIISLIGGLVVFLSEKLLTGLGVLFSVLPITQ